MGAYLRLRQACNHPQIGGRSMLPPLKRAKRALKMTDVLDSLTIEAKVETEDAARAFISASNGLCGAMLLEGGPENLVAAVKLYRSSLKFVTDNRELISIDNLQRSHTLRNLADTFDMISSHGPHPAFSSLRRTTQEGCLREDSVKMRDSYAKSVHSRVVIATGELDTVTEEIGEIDLASWLNEALLSI